MELEKEIMQLIVGAGNARSDAMQAISLAEEGHIKEAKEELAKAEEMLTNAHNIQTELLAREAQEGEVTFSLLLVHSQDHLMNAITLRDIAGKLITIYERIQGGEIDE